MAIKSIDPTCCGNCELTLAYGSQFRDDDDWFAPVNWMPLRPGLRPVQCDLDECYELAEWESHPSTDEHFNDGINFGNALFLCDDCYAKHVENDNDEVEIYIAPELLALHELQEVVCESYTD